MMFGNQLVINKFNLIKVLFIVIFYIGSLMLVNKSKSISLSFAVIIAGAIGNLVDRIIRGYVVDFLDFNIANYHWPAFNLADSYISIGFIVIMINILKGKKI